MSHVFSATPVHTKRIREFQDTFVGQSQPFTTTQPLPGTTCCVFSVCPIVLLPALASTFIQVSGISGSQTPSGSGGSRWRKPVWLLW